MKKSSICIAVGAALSLAACRHHDQPRPEGPRVVPTASLVTVSDVVNALKCELAETFATRQHLRQIVSAGVTASLTLKVEVARAASLEAGPQISVSVFEIGGGYEDSRTTTRSN
jgi:hypothetical protein